MDVAANAGGLRPAPESGLVYAIGPAGDARPDTLRAPIPRAGPVRFAIRRPGSYEVTARAITFAPLSGLVDVAAGEAVSVEVQLRRPAHCGQIVTTAVR